MATITGKPIGLNDAEVGSIDIALCGYGSRSPVARGVGAENGVIMNAAIKNLQATGPSNTYTVTLIGNDNIVPPGTYYAFTFRNDNGDILQCNAYIFLADNGYDLATTDPYDPTQPPPPLPPLIIPQLLIVGVGNPTVFPGDQYTAWKIILTADANAIEVTNLIPGNLYTFIIAQDATGEWAFNWASAANVFNPDMVNPEPDSYTVQTFVCDDALNLYSIGPATWWNT
jgi:hypothetical protein